MRGSGSHAKRNAGTVDRSAPLGGVGGRGRGQPTCVATSVTGPLKGTAVGDSCCDVAARASAGITMVLIMHTACSQLCRRQ